MKREIYIFAFALIILTSFSSAIVFNSQIPADLTTTNIFSSSLNISYNYTFANGNASTYGLAYKINSTMTDCEFILNGNPYNCGWINNSYDYNMSFTYNKLISDNLLYPANYNFDEKSMESAPKLDWTLNGAGTALQVNFINLSNKTTYNFLEFATINNTATSNPLTIYYCNSSYTTTSYVTSTNCVLISTITVSTPPNHSHAGQPPHYIVPLSVNITSNTLSGIVMSSYGQIIFRGSTNGGWNIKYISNVTRTGNSKTSTNTGGSWTNLTGTADVHIHQFTGNETIYYYAYGYNNSGNYNQSAIRYDNLELGGIAPSEVSIYSPVGTYYRQNVLINYSSATSLNNYAITSYNLTLVNPLGTFNKTIRNNALNLTYSYNTSTLSDGAYRIQIVATDQNNLTSTSLSEVFNVDNTLPNINIIEPLPFANLTSYITKFTFNVNDTGFLNNATLYVYNSTNSLINLSRYSLTNLTTGSGQINVSLTDGNYSYQIEVEDLATGRTITNLINFSVTLPPLNANLTLLVYQYPYVDVNISYPLAVLMKVDGISYTNVSVYMNITAPDNTVSNFLLTPNLVNQVHDLTLNFSANGDYHFIIYETTPKVTSTPTTGIFKVRTPYYVTFEGFIDKNTSKYINKYAYLTAEFGESKINGNLETGLEQYLYPFTRELGQTPVFHTPYTNGQAVLKLWEKDVTYNLRLIDGQITFPSSYSVPAITKSYGADIYIGKFYQNGTNQQYDFYLSNQDIHPYRTLANWVLIIGIALSAVIAIALLFIIPQFPIYPIIFGFVMTTMLIILRIALWLGVGD